MIIGIDMGGTNMRAGLVDAGHLHECHSTRINAGGTEQEILQELFTITDRLISADVKAIGIGFPGLAVDGIAYDVYNIPSWTAVPLQQIMEQRYQLPVKIENDANCFAVGEFHFGKGKGSGSMIGLTIGTGMGSGIIIHDKLYGGANGGAGEFGMIPYLDKYMEYYASGQFFKNVYQTAGETVFAAALQGDTAALEMYRQFGIHVGNAVKNLLYALDVSLIVIGGSVRHAVDFFSPSMWEQLQQFEFKRALKKLRIEISELENSGILGAAALHDIFL